MEIFRKCVTLLLNIRSSIFLAQNFCIILENNLCKNELAFLPSIFRDNYKILSQNSVIFRLGKLVYNIDVI